MAVSTPSKIANVVNTHLICVLLGTWVVYGYRDIYPLGTFTLEPLDLHEGWLMWTKLAILTFAAVIVPSFVPTQYIPFDPKVCPPLISKTIAHTTQNPATDINPEQTSSWFSFVFFFFLDDIIFKASRVPHLPAEEFPPLADYDWAPHLVKRSFPVRFHTAYILHAILISTIQFLDPLSGTVSRHMFFGLMRVFRREYLVMCLLLALRVSALHEGPTEWG